MPTDEHNVLGEPLEPCSTVPETGFLRDGHCRHLDRDPGRHEVCAVMTQEFLEYSREQGNDLITPRPEYEFPGLHPATGGVSVCRAGSKPARPATRRRSSWKQQPRACSTR